MHIDFINADLERKWACGVPFGDWRYIRQQVTESIRRRLKVSESSFPQAAPLLEKIQALDETSADRVLGSPFTRAVVFASTRHRKRPWKLLTSEQVGQFLGELEVLISEGWRGGALPSVS